MDNLKTEIQKQILRKLMNMKPPKWGNSHTEFTNLKKGLPKHLAGHKITKKAIRELFILELLIAKKSTNKIHVSLNPKKKEEIFSFLNLKTTH